MPTALLQRSAFTSFFATLFPLARRYRPSSRSTRKRAPRYLGGGEYPYGSGIERAQGLEDMPFDVPNMRIENCPAQNHIRVGWMRSVANIYHAFAICSFADELAIAAGRDPKDYLLELIGDRDASSTSCEAEGVELLRQQRLPVDHRSAGRRQ